MFFSWTLHAIVYFWLMPTYIAYYTIVPRAIGGRLYSDTMARISFILFLVVAMPIGMHHTFADPQVGAGFKFIHSAFTALVALPTLLTVFTICASVEIAARLRGGRGAFGWIRALPWQNPIMLAVAFSFIMLGFGGAGGLINMSYQLDTTIHNTQWITGHFHLIFGGAIVIMYFAIAYDLWPHLTGRALPDLRLVRTQLWLWFVGMIVTTFPWHWVGILGMPRRMAFYDYSGSGDLAAGVLRDALGDRRFHSSDLRTSLSHRLGARACARRPTDAGAYRFSVPVHPVRSVPLALNSYAIWVALMIGLTVTNYGYPILTLALRSGHVRSGCLRGSAVMSARELFTFRNIYFSAGIGIAAGLFLLTAIGGFIVLPYAQPELKFAGLWDAICSAAGLPQRTALVTGGQGRPPPFRGGPDADHAGKTESGIDRTRRDPGATLRDLPRPDRHQPRGLAQPRGSIRRRDLQGAFGLPLRRAHERCDVAIRGEPDGSGDRRLWRHTTPTCRDCRPTIRRRSCRDRAS